MHTIVHAYVGVFPRGPGRHAPHFQDNPTFFKAILRVTYYVLPSLKHLHIMSHIFFLGKGIQDIQEKEECASH